MSHPARSVALVLLARRRRTVAGADVYRSLLNPTQNATAGDPALEPLRQNLRLKFLHDEAKVDDAIAFERERDPSGNLEKWMRAAIARWERDNQ